MIHEGRLEVILSGDVEEHWSSDTEPTEETAAAIHTVTCCWTARRWRHGKGVIESWGMRGRGDVVVPW